MGYSAKALSVNFDVVEQTVIKHLFDLGLSSTRRENHIVTNLQSLEFCRGETQVVIIENESPFFVSVEIKAYVEHPRWGNLIISDLVSHTASSPEEALIWCAQTYLDVTFPALYALLDNSAAARQEKICLSTLTQPENRLTNWRVLTGRLHIKSSAAIAAHQVCSPPPIVLILDTLSGVLSEPKLHWCKFFAARSAGGKMNFGVSIDGQKSPSAENEARSKFQAETNSHDWQLRQFFICVPDEISNPKLTARLQYVAAQKTLKTASEKPRWWLPSRRRT